MQLANEKKWLGDKHWSEINLQSNSDTGCVYSGSDVQNATEQENTKLLILAMKLELLLETAFSQQNAATSISRGPWDSASDMEELYCFGNWIELMFLFFVFFYLQVCIIICICVFCFAVMIYPAWLQLWLCRLTVYKVWC